MVVWVALLHYTWMITEHVATGQGSVETIEIHVCDAQRAYSRVCTR
jgi:hypothetical protein